MSLAIRKPAPSGLSVYAIIRRHGDEFRWIVGDGFEAYNAANLDSYDVPLTDDGGDVYSTDLAFTAAAGRYVIAYYLREGATPAADDFKLPGEDVVDWTGTALSSSVHYSSVALMYAELGEANALIDGNLSSSGTNEDSPGMLEDSLRQSDGRVNRKLALASPPPAVFPVTSTEAWVTDDIRTAATKYAAGFLLNKRSRQPSKPDSPSNGDLLIADGDVILAELIAAGLLGVTTTEDETPNAGTFAFAPINRDVCTATGDENTRPLLWY